VGEQRALRDYEEKDRRDVIQEYKKKTKRKRNEMVEEEKDEGSLTRALRTTGESLGGGARGARTVF